MSSTTYGAIKLATAEEVGTILKKKMGTVNGYKPKEWADTINLLGKLPIRTASGSIAHFTDGADDVPLKSLTAQIVPIQSGTGDPSPSNPRPISGTSVLNVTRAGKNLCGDEDLADFIVANVEGSSKDAINKTVTYAANKVGGVVIFDKFKANARYTFFASYSGTNSNLCFEFTDGTNLPVNNGVTVSTAGKTVKRLRGQFQSGTTILNYDQFGIFEGVLTSQDFEQYTGSTYPIPLGRTVYGGSADVVGGEGEVTYKKITLNGSEAWGSWIADNHLSLLTIEDKYSRTLTGNKCNILKVQGITGWANMNDLSIAFNVGSASNQLVIGIRNNSITSLQDFKTWLSNNPVDLVYLLDTPTDFTFEGEEINSLEGVNNVWADTGDTEVEYRADIDILINELGG